MDLMSLENFKILVITPEHGNSNEPELIANLFEAGLESLHLRKPNYIIEEMRKFITSIPAEFHPRIVIHSHYELLSEFNLKGIHLPEKKRNEGYLTSLKKIISTSFHKLEDLIDKKILLEYAFFSPVFQSISKQGYRPSINTTSIKEFLLLHKNEINFRVIALGGITEKNIMAARDMGFHGVACIGHIWDSSNPIEQYNKLLKAVRS